MQTVNKNIKILTTELGDLVRNIREDEVKIPLEQLANEYDIPKSTLSKIERGVHNCQFVNLWKISEALNIKCSDLIKLLEERLGDSFSLTDE